MARTAATTRTTASQRRVIRPYTKSWSMNGTNSCAYVAALNLSAYNKLTFDFWFRPELGASSGSSMIVELSNNSAVRTDSFYLDWNEQVPNKLYAVQFAAGSTYSTWASATLAVKDTYHVVLRLDRTLSGSTATKIYVNGTSSGASVVGSANLAGNFGNQSFNVGARAAASSLPFKGNIKDFQICSFTGTFADADAMTLYKNEIPSIATPIHRWGGEDAGATATNSVGSTSLTLANIAYDTNNFPTKTRSTISDNRNAVV